MSVPHGNWAPAHGVANVYFEPGKPWQNGVDESFNGKLRAECLEQNGFRNRVEAMVVIEAWRRYYNATRPHSALGYLTPNEFKRFNHQRNARPIC